MLANKKQLIPVAIITGYLGSGKTTLIRRILMADHALKITVLVHDIGDAQLETQMMRATQDQSQPILKNGSTIIHIETDLVQTLATLVQSDTARPDYIIIEQQGISDPSSTILKLNRSFLRNHLEIDTIIAVVDAHRYHTRQTQPLDLLNKQLRLADIVILNKADRISKKSMQKVEAWAKNTINRATIYHANYCDVPLKKIISIGTYNPQTAFDTSGHGVHAYDVEDLNAYGHHEKSVVYSVYQWECEDALVLDTLRQVIDHLPGGIFRIKGIVYLREFPDHQMVLQFVNRRVTLTRGSIWNEQTPMTKLLFVGDIGSYKRQVLDVQFEQARATLHADIEVPRRDDDVIEWEQKRT